MVDKNGSSPDWKYAVKVSWFLRAVSFAVRDGEEFRVRVLGIKLKAFGLDDEALEDKALEDETAEPVEAVESSAMAVKPHKPSKEPKPKPKPKSKPKIKSQLEKIRGLDGEIIKDALNIAAKKLLPKILPKKFRVRGKVGLEEPHLTGMVMALVSGVSVLSPKFDVVMAGDFEEPALELDVDISGGFRISQIAGPVLKLYKLYKLMERE